MQTPLPSRAHVAPHDHAVHIYGAREELLGPLGAFVEDGVRQRDLPVFVHSFGGNAEAREFLARGLPSLPKHEEAGLTMSYYQDAFEKGGRIDHAHAGGVVEMLRASAARGGRRCPRIFVDASRRYFDEGRVDEWFAFESWLGPRLKADVGLVCAYRAADLRDPDVLRRVLETHAYRFDVTP